MYNPTHQKPGQYNCFFADFIEVRDIK